MGKEFIKSGIHNITGRRVRRRRRGNGTKHAKGTINHQLQKFIPLGLVSWVTVIYFAPWGEGKQRRDEMPLFFVCLFVCFFVLSDTSPRIPIFARPNRYSWQTSTTPLVLVTVNRSPYFAPWGEGGQRRGVMPLGLFLFNREMQAYFWQFCFAWPKSLGKVV